MEYHSDVPLCVSSLMPREEGAWGKWGRVGVSLGIKVLWYGCWALFEWKHYGFFMLPWGR